MATCRRLKQSNAANQIMGCAVDSAVRPSLDPGSGSGQSLLGIPSCGRLPPDRRQPGIPGKVCMNPRSSSPAKVPREDASQARCERPHLGLSRVPPRPGKQSSLPCRRAASHPPCGAGTPPRSSTTRGPGMTGSFAVASGRETADRPGASCCSHKSYVAAAASPALLSLRRACRQEQALRPPPYAAPRPAWVFTTTSNKLANAPVS